MRRLPKLKTESKQTLLIYMSIYIYHIYDAELGSHSFRKGNHFIFIERLFL
jgi:hypothetical protein